MDAKNKQFIEYVSALIRSCYDFVNPEIADFIACQSALETAYGRSTIYLENHNLFGMKVPKVRMSNCIGENRSHALYKNENCSVCDFFFWLQYNGFCQSHLKGNLTDYITKFKRTAFNPSYDYVPKIQTIYQSFKS